MTHIIQYSHARSMRIAVLVMLPAPRRQQPTTPVQKATKSKKKETIKSAIMARPMSWEKKTQKVNTIKQAWENPNKNSRRRAIASSLKLFVAPLSSGM